jgi:hypothetical protein
MFGIKLFQQFKFLKMSLKASRRTNSGISTLLSRGRIPRLWHFGSTGIYREHVFLCGIRSLLNGSVQLRRDGDIVEDRVCANHMDHKNGDGGRWWKIQSGYSNLVVQHTKRL